MWAARRDKFERSSSGIFTGGYGIDARFADAINRCKVSLDIAAYQINSRRRDRRNPRFLHHNTIIVDDAIVITGSLNFSRMSFDSNDGNILILPLPELAAKYVEEFYRLWGVATKPPKTQAEGGAK